MQMRRQRNSVLRTDNTKQLRNWNWGHYAAFTPWRNYQSLKMKTC